MKMIAIHCCFLLLIVYSACSQSQSSENRAYLNTYVQRDTFVTSKSPQTWVILIEGKTIRGFLAGRSGNDLLLYPPSVKSKNINIQYTPERISYHNISMIKTKKPNGVLKGLLIGAGIGLLPIVAGQGGAYAAIITFPVGIITGAVIGATSKKKYRIDKNYQAFHHFTSKYIHQ